MPGRIRHSARVVAMHTRMWIANKSLILPSVLTLHEPCWSSSLGRLLCHSFQRWRKLGRQWHYDSLLCGLHDDWHSHCLEHGYEQQDVQWCCAKRDMADIFEVFEWEEEWQLQELPPNASTFNFCNRESNRWTLWTLWTLNITESPFRTSGKLHLYLRFGPCDRRHLRCIWTTCGGLAHRSKAAMSYVVSCHGAW